MEESSKSVLCWMKKRPFYVSATPNLIFRSKIATKFGENHRGFFEGNGELTEASWTNFVALSPTCLEINHPRNPFHELVEKLTNDESKLFFSRVRSLSLFESSIELEMLVDLLKRFVLLACFTYSDFHLSDQGWDQLARALSSLQLRALDASGGGLAVVERLLGRLDIALLRLSGSPGFRVTDFERTNTTFPTIKALVISDLCHETDQDAEKLFSLIPSRFGQLECLIVDWSVVDPEVRFDERTNRILSQLIPIFTNLKAFGIICYTPCAQTKAAAGEMTRILAESGLHEPNWRLFASRGLATENRNFSLLLGGADSVFRERIERAFEARRQSLPHIRHLLPLVDPETSLDKRSILVDFGGLDSKQIRQDLSEYNFTNAT